MLQSVVRAEALDDAQGKARIQPKVALKAQAFRLDDVRLLEGPFQRAMELDKQYLLALDPDRLLHTFRLNAKLPSAAQPLGGWEAPTGELRGHSMGHYLSAVALMYAGTGDEKLKQRAEYLIAELAKCQTALGTSGYLSAYPETFFDRVEARRQVWAPYYTMHKIFAGLLDVYDYCGNPQALEVCRKFADWVIARNAKLTDEQMQNMLGEEHGGMNEALTNLYVLTGEEKYLKIALRFNHKTVIDPASQRQDTLTGLHANTQIPKFIGTAREFEVTGRDELKTASLFFWENVVRERSYVIGGHSDSEHFSAKERLSESLGQNTAETCNTYNMLKLTRHLFCWDPNAEYADYYERALVNHILASQNPETGMVIYFARLRSGSVREYSTPNNSFWCCTGTGMENHAKYGDSIYFHDSGKNLWLNLFIASELNWKARGLKVRQDTRFPDEGRAKLTFTAEKPVEMSLNIRHPYWATAGFEIKVNGEKLADVGKPSAYVVVTRTWKTGDTVEIAMPFSLRTEGFRDNPNRFAFLNGPIVLGAEVDVKKPFPVIVADEAKTTSSLKAVTGKSSMFTAGGDTFRITGETGDAGVTLEPYYKMHGQRRYEVYWDRFSAEQWQTKEKEYQAQLARQKELETRTVDLVTAGFEQNERDHNVQGENTQTRTMNDTSLRTAGAGGWFSWDLKVLPDQPQELVITYRGGARAGTFDVFVEGVKLTVELAAASGSPQGGAPSTATCSLNPEWVKGKSRITLKFQAGTEGRIGSIFSVRVLKPAAGQ
jgi:uncharacterized protein